MSFSNYLLLANIYLAAFFIFYKLLLDKETYFKLNRIYLLCAGLLSMALPFCRSSWLYNETVSKNVQTFAYFDVMVQPGVILADAKPNVAFTDILVLIYFIGIVFLLGRLVVNILRTKTMLSKNVAGAAYSFFGTKRIDQNLPAADIISMHEDVHIRQHHSTDVILFELLAVFNWFNPFVHLYKKSLQDIHEFLADEESANNYKDRHAYAVLIVSNVLGVEPSVLMHGFFKKSLIKKRIYMLHKNKSKRTALLKYGLFLPLFTLAAVLSSATLNTNKKLARIADKIDVEKSIEVANTVLPKAMKIRPKLEKKTVALRNTFNKKNNVNLKLDWQKFYKFVGDHIKYPTEAQDNNISGNCQVTFNIRNGKVVELSNEKPFGHGFDEEVMKAVLSYPNFDKSFDGKYAFGVAFFLQDRNNSGGSAEKIDPLEGYTNLSNVVVIAYKKSEAFEDSVKKAIVIPHEKTNDAEVSLDEATVKDKSSQTDGAVSTIRVKQKQPQGGVYDFVSVDKAPNFPGGLTKFYEYVGKAIKYPKRAQEANIQGKVYLQFVVEKDGSLTDIEVIRGPGAGINEEAVRVLKESPRWYPGVADGKTVRVRFNIALNFSLGKDAKSDRARLHLDSAGSANTAATPLYILNGKEVTINLGDIPPGDIESINILKSAEATKTYGDKGKNGVIIIKLKKKSKTKE